MKLNSILLLVAFGTVPACPLTVSAQGPPDVVWEVATPSGLANSIQGVGWSPNTNSPRVAVGSTDRWVRTRQAANGALVYSVLQPIRSGGADQTIYSTDGAYLAVHNRSGGLGYRVHRASDGLFLGALTVTVDANGIVRFAADAQLISSVGGDGTFSRWRFSEFTVVFTVGSGYQRTTTTFNLSPTGVYQSAASRGTITIQRRSDAAVIRTLTGGPAQGFTPVAFTPDNTRIAAWNDSPNRTTLWRVSDGAVLMQFPGAAAQEGVAAIRFTADGQRLVTTGYLPFQTPEGLWDQNGVIRFWRVADGALRRVYDQRTGIGVTSPVAWSPDGSRFAYGTYEGTAVAARTPAP